jgi:hypothetical protein
VGLFHHATCFVINRNCSFICLTVLLFSTKISTNTSLVNFPMDHKYAPNRESITLKTFTLWPGAVAFTHLCRQRFQQLPYNGPSSQGVGIPSGRPPRSAVVDNVNTHEFFASDRFEKAHRDLSKGSILAFHVPLPQP